MEGKRVNRSAAAAAAIASPSWVEGAAAAQVRLEELKRRLVAQRARARKQVDLSTANLLFMDSGVNRDGVSPSSRFTGVNRDGGGGAAAAISHGKMAKLWFQEEQGVPKMADYSLFPQLPELDCFHSTIAAEQRAFGLPPDGVSPSSGLTARPAAISHGDPKPEQSLLPLLPDSNCFYSTELSLFAEERAFGLPPDEDRLFSMDDIIAAPEKASSSSGGICWRDVEEEVERQSMQYRAYMVDQLTRIEDRLPELEDAAERREMLLRSAMKQGFMRLRAEVDERWNARLKKLEQEHQRRETRIRTLERELHMGEPSPVKVAASLDSHLQEDDKNIAAAGKKKRGWMKWIPAAIIVAVGVAVVAKSSK